MSYPKNQRLKRTIFPTMPSKGDVLDKYQDAVKC